MEHCQNEYEGHQWHQEGSQLVVYNEDEPKLLYIEGQLAVSNLVEVPEVESQGENAIIQSAQVRQSNTASSQNFTGPNTSGTVASKDLAG